eukprot:TRINITY_DN3629_c0_g1_i5.p3 TRINITY_DN3629_c0_g1~~TRINITY_DN3629_c0_g1_i5.p3  ORF type:complete len:133 (-),score=30.30 TRINITY_DN3629_c0_g1_i5:125-523(-)
MCIRDSNAEYMGVIQLTKSSYDQLIRNIDKTKQKLYWFVEIYDPNTTNQKAIDYHNEYLKFAEKVRNAKAAQITASDAKEICKEYDIYEFPTVLFFDKKIFHARIYTGEHTEKELMKFAIIATNQKGPNNRI